MAVSGESGSGPANSGDIAMRKEENSPQVVASDTRDLAAAPAAASVKQEVARPVAHGDGQVVSQGGCDAVTSGGGEGRPLRYGSLDRGYKAFARWMSYLGAVALGVITVVCFVDVVGSKFFGKAIPSQFELVANLNLVVVFLAAFYVQMDRGSVAIELLQDRLPRGARLFVRVFGSLLGAAVCFFSAYRGWYYLADFWQSRKSASGVWHFPIWPFQAVLVFGFFCLGVAFLFTVARDVTDCRARRGRFAPRSAREQPASLERAS